MTGPRGTQEGVPRAAGTTYALAVRASRRHPTGALLSVLLAWWALAFLPVLHGVQTRLHLCPTHGAWSHGRVAPDDLGAGGEADDGHALRPATGGEDEDDHCALSAQRRDAMAARTAARVGPVGDDDAAAVPGHLHVPVQAARHRLAPKRSPPA